MPDPGNRYQPLALVPDTAVQAHAFRNSFEETRFYSVNKANSSPPSLEEGHKENLIEEIGRLQCHAGNTVLSAVTYDTKDSDEVWLRIFVETCFPGPMEHQHRNVKYNMSLKQFMMLKVLKPENSVWITDLEDLMSRCSDRAFLHVSLRFNGRGIEDDSKWKPRRQPHYETVLGRLVKAVDPCSLAEADQCPACMESLSEGNPVSLPCSEKHMLHLDCLLQICQAEKMLDKIRCPFDRAALSTDREALLSLKYGFRDGEYLEDDRYNVWENYERSFALHDKALTENNHEPMAIDSSGLQNFLNIICEGARWEPASSTPFHLQPVRCPEFQLFKQTVETTLKSLDEVRMPISMLYRMHLTDIDRAFRFRYLQGGQHRKLSPEERASLLSKPSHMSCFMGIMRPEFREFVKRTLNRLLRHGCTQEP